MAKHLCLSSPFHCQTVRRHRSSSSRTRAQRWLIWTNRSARTISKVLNTTCPSRRRIPRMPAGERPRPHSPTKREKSIERWACPHSVRFPQRVKIWLFDFSDDPKVRPALTVSIDTRNELASSVLAVPITPNQRPTPTVVLLPAEQGGLAHHATARCERVSYLHKSRLSSGPVGTKISPALMRERQICLLRSFGISPYLTPAP